MFRWRHANSVYWIQVSNLKRVVKTATGSTWGTTDNFDVDWERGGFCNSWKLPLVPVVSFQCTATCGRGYQMRAVKCVSEQFGTLLDDRECQEASRPSDSQVKEVSSWIRSRNTYEMEGLLISNIHNVYTYTYTHVYIHTRIYILLLFYTLKCFASIQNVSFLVWAPCVSRQCRSIFFNLYIPTLSWCLWVWIPWPWESVLFIVQPRIPSERSTLGLF